MATVRSSQELADLLDKFPRHWACALAMRGSLRILPYALIFDQNVADSGLFMSLFRCNFLMWATVNCPSVNFSQPAYAALNDLEKYRNRHQSHGFLSLIIDCTYLAMLSHFIDVSESQGNSIKSINLSMYILESWDSVNSDYEWLIFSNDITRTYQNLSRRSLWLRKRPRQWFDLWRDSKSNLIFNHPEFEPWIDWFSRRIDGHRSAFDIPNDKRRAQDKRIVEKLARAIDKDFWQKGPLFVGNTLQNWIDEARARVAQPALAILPSQNLNAIAFRQGDDGKIALDTSADLDVLRTDFDARDRHAELQRLAGALLARCQGSNAGARLTGFLENYIEALGDSNESQRPSLLVQRGNRLDVERKAYGDPATLLDPLADDVLVDLGNLVSAHNMHVMIEPALRDRATAMLGPDAKPVLILPKEICEVAEEADKQGILAAGVREIVEEAAQLAPTPPDAESRLTIWSTETVKNLIIEAFAIVRNNKLASAAVVGSIALAPPQISIGAAVLAANFLLKRREWVESRLGNSPTWKSLFIDLCNWWEKNKPPE